MSLARGESRLHASCALTISVRVPILVDSACFDAHASDHLAQCSGTATDATATPDCAAAFAAANNYDAASCPAGCTYTAAPRFRPGFVHAPDVRMPGWLTPLTGACRTEPASWSGTVQTRASYKYCRDCGANGVRLTQQECAAACVAEPECIAYHSGPWCSVFGRGFGRNNPNARLAAGQSPNWVGVNHTDPATNTEITTIDGSNTNTQYICVRPCGTTTSPTNANGSPNPNPACPIGEASGRYSLVGNGGCRGNGGSSDHVNHKYASGMSQEQCQTECDTDSDCSGYAYSATTQSGQCIIYGPGMAGTCTGYPNLRTQTACANYGTCSDATKTSEETCGRCSDTSVLLRTLCNNLEFTWTPFSWSATPGTWAPPPNPWAGDSHPTTHIHGIVANSAYQCFDIITDDHVAQCHGSDSHTTATVSDSECHERFALADDFLAASCPTGCVYEAAPSFTRIRIPHPPDIRLPGWLPARAGACRDGPDTATHRIPNYKYTRTAGADTPASTSGFRYGSGLTQAECAAACVAEPTCFGYHHGPWCSVFGRDIHLTPNSQGSTGWGPGLSEDGNGNQVLSIGGTRANVEYICVEMDMATHPARQPGYCTGGVVPSPVVAPTACSPSSPSSTDDDSSDDEEPAVIDTNTASALTDSLASIGVEGGAVAGIAVGCFFFGLLLGVLLTCVCKQTTTPSVTSSTTKAVEVVKTDALSKPGENKI